ncbi:MAG: MBL fold metallo-hydrolase [Opitutales bacterium]|nr:MBL fold metallo-hydrolase [Opitutales bacterium]
MNFTDLNKSGGIGSNSSLIELGNFKFLVDSGLHPKEVGKGAVPQLELLDGVDLDFIVLTHCHLDHLGSLPIVMKRYPDVPVFMSLPSRVLAPRMLRNSVNVMKRQRKEQGIPEYPLFTFSDVDHISARFHPLRFEQPEVITKGADELVITLYPSGHVAGAASMLVEHADETVYFTGDLLFDDLQTLPGARIPDMKVDVLVTETTRGLTQRAQDSERDQEWERLFAGVTRTIEQGGTCLLPVFALGRMQEVLAVFADAQKRGKIPRCPIFSAGLGMDIVDYFDQISRETGLIRFRKKVLKQLRVESPRIPQNPGFDKLPKGIYVVSSGMMVEKTPSYSLASCLLHSDLNSVYFVGYCDPDTPGGKLKACTKGEKFWFDVYDLETELHAEVDSFDLSGHADREEILDLVAEFEPQKVVLTHGDPEARRWFAEKIAEESLAPNVIDPEPCVKTPV